MLMKRALRSVLVNYAQEANNLAEGGEYEFYACWWDHRLSELTRDFFAYAFFFYLTWGLAVRHCSPFSYAATQKLERLVGLICEKCILILQNQPDKYWALYHVQYTIQLLCNAHRHLCCRGFDAVTGRGKGIATHFHRVRIKHTVSFAVLNLQLGFQADW